VAHLEQDFHAIGSMPLVTLDEMQAVELMNRIDTKFITDISVLDSILDDAYSAGYKVCEITGHRLLRYTSIYYDTDDLEMFSRHRNGKKTRQKIRVRSYHINGENYLEIKNKQNTGRTRKRRIRITDDLKMDFSKSKEAAAFIDNHSKYGRAELTPETSTDFQRITLTNKAMSERITIDIDLNFTNYRNGILADIGKLVIIEVKQDSRNISRMKAILLKHRVFPYRVSKYCLSVIMTEHDIHPGRYKEKLRHIHKITEQR